MQNNWNSLIHEARLVCTAMNIEQSPVAYCGHPVRMVPSEQITSCESDSIFTGGCGSSATAAIAASK